MAAIVSGLDRIDNDMKATEGGGLNATLSAVAATAIARSDLWILIRRDSTHLPVDELRAVRARFAAFVRTLSERILEEQPALGEANAAWVARAVIATFAAPSQYPQRLSPRHLQATLVHVSGNLLIIDASEDQAVATPYARQGPFDPAASRREQLLQHASVLFADRGYQEVSIDDIGAAADIAGPSIYHHFRSKSEILVAILRRAIEWIEFDRMRATRESDDPQQVLTLLVRSYTLLALDHPELFRIFTHESIHLPREERVMIRNAHRQFFTSWVSLLAQVRPELTDAQAQTLVSCALCVINDLSLSKTIRADAKRELRLAQLAFRVLETP
ncbi:TetR/AcrR family transcriptional regulator [Pseudarthrobacter sp. NIBRBAC000502772]|uniref:TetR/AcrR family transcriptional regulator n=1 Tax=Pseudarthrobacter sp. NIBRBAC000502772 TaxID=2590775 RepID=UPI0011302258|nr:TetR/AcrR family transcriptional regulator [Pseudarthrobacter sp. NIBRBAC000502772]QDG66712.1 TetR/AcrR family transcriptional regulator [Pseudarthrobacter sp. NIBRBAC000502772]